MLINNIIGQPHKGWSLGGSSSSLASEQSYFIGQQTVDDMYQNRAVSLKKLYHLLRIILNRKVRLNKIERLRLILNVNSQRWALQQKRSIKCNTEEACSTFFSNQTTFCVFVQFSFEELDSIPRMEINRQQGECSVLFSFTVTK